MTYGELKSLLQSLYGKKQRLAHLRQYIDEELAEIIGISGSQFDGPRVESSAQNGTEERYIKHFDRIREYEKTYDELFAELNKDEKIIMRLMETLTPVEYDVILNRYFRGLPRREVAEMMHYEEEWIKRLQSSAIKKMFGAAS